MSIQAMAWAWSVEGLTSNTRLVLLAIADACDSAGYGYPGQARLAKMCCLSERRVRSNVKALEELGLVEVEIRSNGRGGRSSNGYKLLLPESYPQGDSPTGHQRPVGEFQPDVCDTPTGQQRPVGEVPTGRSRHSNRTLASGPSYPSEEPKENISGRARAREGLTSQNDQRVTAAAATDRHNEMPNGTSEEEGFDLFWQRFPKKVAKKEAARAWKALSESKREKALDHLADDPYAGREKQYLPNPATYLRGERWNDEDIPHETHRRIHPDKVERRKGKNRELAERLAAHTRSLG